MTARFKSTSTQGEGAACYGYLIDSQTSSETDLAFRLDRQDAGEHIISNVWESVTSSCQSP